MELIVVVSIIAIMAVSVSVGFRYMGDAMRTKQVAGIITDVVKRTEMEVLRGDYKKSTINFLTNYLVIESEPENKSLVLSLGDSTGCADGNNLNLGTGVLTKKDGDGKVLGIKSVAGGTECVPFTTSPETEWQYQLSSGDQVSPLVRFIHFNIERDKPENAIQLSDVDSSDKLVIEAPYAKKSGTVSVKVGDETEPLTFP